ncbi:MAG: transglycosylase SLT domain-containing protein, partial [Candidatus Magnetoovum sp. WYHC-5]|nr:transglycosylase SLT domain-containing protein [Candidatus Magnetoovum sp. WYHC-5]
TLILGTYTTSESAQPVPANVLRLTEPLTIPCSKGIRTQVDFWIDIFAKYNSYESVIHDNRYLDIVFSVVDAKELGANTTELEKEAVESEIEKYKVILDSLQKKTNSGQANFTKEEKQVYKLYETVSGNNKFIEAKERIRSQRGQRDRFREALSRCTLYMKDMEKIFKENGLPVEITRLPFLESLFNISAVSSAGASGLWQFTKSTGKIYMTIDEYIDERFDPIKSTKAAARFIKSNYNSLDSWALALTAYNHGTAGMKNAIAQTGTTDIKYIIDNYKGKGFGFASRNFYAEFMAVLEISHNYQYFFDDIIFQRPQPYDTIYIKSPVKLDAFTKSCSADFGQIVELNPALTEAVLNSELALPVGFELKVPAGTAKTAASTCMAYIEGKEKIR